MSEQEAELQLERKNKDRKEKAIKLLREEKQKEREARKKRRQLTYETYIDSNNEMKVRLPKSSAGGKSSPVKIESTKNNRTAPTVPKVAPIAMLPNQEIKPKPVAEKTSSAADPSGPNQQKPLRSIAPARGSQHQCSVARCAVRLVDEEKLRLHERAHRGGAFLCPLCGAKEAAAWPAMRLHLWQEHR